jgi:uncharacterized protein YlaN (UPF0358 family)
MRVLNDEDVARLLQKIKDEFTGDCNWLKSEIIQYAINRLTLPKIPHLSVYIYDKPVYGEEKYDIQMNILQKCLDEVDTLLDINQERHEQLLAIHEKVLQKQKELKCEKNTG